VSKKVEDKMAKVRAARKPPKYSSIHPDVKKLPDDHPGSLKTVKKWEKHNKERVKDLKAQIRKMEKSKDKSILERELNNREGYIKNIKRYLDTSIWLDLFYGLNQEHKTKYKTIVHAYDNEGYIKRGMPDTPSVG
jgi:hypothetical protein